ncbi:MAG: hypothetical protein ABSD75_18560 [Terriglobales bacterium]|jgi:hypothetical protein
MRGFRGGVGVRRQLRPFTSGILSDWPLFSSEYDAGEQPAENAPLQGLGGERAAFDDSRQNGKSAPLLIEWRGDRYVRFGGVGDTAGAESSAGADYAESTTVKVPMPAAQRQSQVGEHSPAVLVYRDGHREEIADYAIVEGVIYVGSNYWQSGQWTKQVPLSALDAPATLQANRQRGAKFILPSASNVVIASF